MPDVSSPSLAELRFEWLWVYDGVVPTAETWSKDIVVPASVFFVIAGHARVRAAGREINLPHGTALLAAQGIRRQWFASGTRLLSVAYRATWPGGAPLFAAGLNRAVAASKIRSLLNATRTLYQDQHGTKHTVSHQEAVGLHPAEIPRWCLREAAYHAWFAAYTHTLAGLGIEPSVRRRTSDHRISEIIRRLDSWPMDKAMVVEELAVGLNIGGRRLEQLLATSLGTTPHSHLNQRRIEAARRSLTATITPLKQIAHELGFRHAPHFTKWFRRHVGIAPSAYRDGVSNEAV